MINSVSETIKNEGIEQKFGFIGKLLDILGASLLESILAGKGVIRAGEEVIQGNDRTIRAGGGVIATSWRRGTIRADQDFKCRLIL